MSNIAYLGMNAATGRRLTDAEHLAQSVRKVLSTPIGSRIARRTFGSLVPDLIDAPGNRAATVQLYAAAATALARWEPRLRLQQVTAAMDAKTPGRFVLTVVGERIAGQAREPVRIAASLGA